MELNEAQQAMLDGSCGKGAALAMRVLTGIGKCFEAQRMVPITRAHVSLSAQEADVWFAGRLRDAGAVCAVPPTVNPGYSLAYFGDRISPEAVENMQRTHRIYQDLGAWLTYSCTPYLSENVPERGEIVAFSETNATIYVNSVLGARTNRESAASALCAAVTGCTPEYGMLLPENRRASIAVEVKTELKNDFDFAVLGMMGQRIGRGIPAFLGLSSEISTESLIALGTQLNVSGSCDLFHIPGVTPEAENGVPWTEGGPVRTVTVTREDLDRTLQEFSPDPTGEIHCCILGCPHYTYPQLIRADRLLNGKPSKVPVYILTSAAVKRQAHESGLEGRLNDAGAELIADTCVDEPCCWGFLAGKPGVTDSPKGAYYMETAGVKLAVRDIDTCIRWAQKGRVC